MDHSRPRLHPALLLLHRHSASLSRKVSSKTKIPTHHDRLEGTERTRIQRVRFCEPPNLSRLLHTHVLRAFLCHPATGHDTTTRI